MSAPFFIYFFGNFTIRGTKTMKKETAVNRKANAIHSTLARGAALSALVVSLSACQTMENLDKQLTSVVNSMQSGMKGVISSDETSSTSLRKTSVNDSLNSSQTQETASISGAARASEPPKGSSGEITADVDTNNRVVRRYQAALALMLQAQSIFQEALNIDVDRQKAEATAKMLESGIVEKSELESATALTAENDALIREKLDAGVKLDEQGREKYAEALPIYALGTLNSSLIVPEVLAYANEVQSTISQISSNPLMVFRAASLAQGAVSVLYVASELPTLVSKWYDNTSTLITFGQENEVDVSDAKDAMEQVEL